MKASLVVKINAIIILAVSISAALLCLYGYSMTKRDLETNLTESLQSIADRLQKSLIMPLWNVDNQVLEMVVLTEMQDINVSAIKVLDGETKEELISKLRNDDRVIIDGDFDFSTSPKYRNIEKVLSFQGIDIGLLSVSMTDEFVLQNFEVKTIDVLTQTALFLITAIVVLSILLHRIIINPIRELTQISKIVAQGNFNLDIKTSRKDEIGILATSFEFMKLAVKDKIASLNDEIEERAKAEQELGELRSLLSSTIDSMPSILIGVDKNGWITQWNLEAEKHTGVTAKHAYTRPLEIVMPQMSERMMMIHRAMEEMEVKKQSKVSCSVEGEDRIADITVYPLKDDAFKGAVIRIDDVTERVRLEEMMVQTEKMMSVGGLAAGMAHEINNPLAGIMQNVQVIQNRLSLKMRTNLAIAEKHDLDMQSLLEYMEERNIPAMFDAVVESGKQAALIVNNMLTFSRKNHSGFLNHDLIDLLERSITLSASSYNLKSKSDFKQITLLREYQGDVPEVRCDDSMIQQVFMNLLGNAAHALFIDELIKERLAGRAKPKIILRVRRQEEIVKVEIEDNGIGLDENMCKRIFEPFFTTKPVGEGTGLGLSVSYFIVAETHNGQLEVTSIPGEGTCFTISLPVV